MIWKMIKGNWRKARHHRDKGYTKKFFHIHYVWKYRFFVPLLLIAEKVMGKYLEKEVPPGKEFDELRIFSRAVDDSIRPWFVWIKNDYNNRRKSWPAFKRFRTKERDESWVDNSVKVNKSARWVKLMRDLLVTVIVHDTAYRPLFDEIMKQYCSRKNIGDYDEHMEIDKEFLE